LYSSPKFLLLSAKRVANPFHKIFYVPAWKFLLCMICFDGSFNQTYKANLSVSNIFSNMCVGIIFIW
jgi:hypothetical protein